MRRLFLACLLLASAGVAARKPVAISTSASPWPGAGGRLVHGYVAIPVKARGPQPAVLVLAGTEAGDQAAAHALAEALARAGFFACTPRGDERHDDLLATLAWLGTNRYATGKVALVAAGPSAVRLAQALVAAAPAGGADALLALGDGPAAPQAPGAIDTLHLRALDPQADLPVAAITFLREHLQ